MTTFIPTPLTAGKSCLTWEPVRSSIHGNFDISKTCCLTRLAVDLDDDVSFPNPLYRGARCRGDLAYEDYSLEVWEVECRYAPFEYAYLTCEVDTY